MIAGVAWVEKFPLSVIAVLLSRILGHKALG